MFRRNGRSGAFPETVDQAFDNIEPATQFFAVVPVKRVPDSDEQFGLLCFQQFGDQGRFFLVASMELLTGHWSHKIHRPLTGNSHAKLPLIAQVDANQRFAAATGGALVAESFREPS
jgi:hypothetical protein